MPLPPLSLSLSSAFVVSRSPLALGLNKFLSKRRAPAVFAWRKNGQLAQLGRATRARSCQPGDDAPKLAAPNLSHQVHCSTASCTLRQARPAQLIGGASREASLAALQPSWRRCCVLQLLVPSLFLLVRVDNANKTAGTNQLSADWRRGSTCARLSK